jgi:hypothetical protein
VRGVLSDVAVLPDGTLVLTYGRCRERVDPLCRSRVYVSRDSGATWSGPVDGAVTASEADLLVSPAGDLAVLNPLSRAGVVSSDGGTSWQELRLVADRTASDLDPTRTVLLSGAPPLAVDARTATVSGLLLEYGSRQGVRAGVTAAPGVLTARSGDGDIVTVDLGQTWFAVPAVAGDAPTTVRSPEPGTLLRLVGEHLPPSSQGTFCLAAIQRSTDGGRRWSTIPVDPARRIAWPTAAADGAGYVAATVDGALARLNAAGRVVETVDQPGFVERVVHSGPSTVLVTREGGLVLVRGDSSTEIQLPEG